MTQTLPSDFFRGRFWPPDNYSYEIPNEYLPG